MSNTPHTNAQTTREDTDQRWLSTYRTRALELARQSGENTPAITLFGDPEQTAVRDVEELYNQDERLAAKLNLYSAAELGSFAVGIGAIPALTSFTRGDGSWDLLVAWPFNALLIFGVARLLQSITWSNPRRSLRALGMTAVGLAGAWISLLLPLNNYRQAVSVFS
ncbi:hypothetical protein [Corynebacterium argentoratense]|uniref:hypothetical protein n=1 Tax=Corynebacterium argentoratense TaxID=42817 RepID=UPI001F275286|nr:hypothetical protein [Corynebacterium argentoratense]MCF1765055.1 hypothetical protein [Corynebacterium argentoratense]